MTLLDPKVEVSHCHSERSHVRRGVAKNPFNFWIVPPSTRGLDDIFDVSVGELNPEWINADIL